MKVLFICTGNTCRSPMAAALLNKIANKNDIDIQATSAGVFAENGAPASSNAILAMNRYEIDISSHKAKQLNEKMIADADVVLTMTEGQKTMICALAPEKIFTICEYAGYDGDIQDPYGGNKNQYIQTAEEIYDVLTDVAEKIYDLTEK